MNNYRIDEFAPIDSILNSFSTDVIPEISFSLKKTDYSFWTISAI
ncbi:MAG: hypothetical protein PWQ51_2262 [Methanolobus sp.]|jgi:hypothetical protein|nr:hypothetical protein [Methanolobus sp.]